MHVFVVDVVSTQCSLALVLSIAPVWSQVYTAKTVTKLRMGVGKGTGGPYR